jgi:DNA-binding transcriptional MocR family regulator
MAHLYLELANELAGSIDKGVYRTGERLPGVRTTSQQRGVSVATVVSAYRHLESVGYIESRPRSGFVVKPRQSTNLLAPDTTNPPTKPKAVTGKYMILQLAQMSRQPDIVSFGAAVPRANYLPTQTIAKTLMRVARQQRHKLCNYDFPWGEVPLASQVAKRLVDSGCSTDPDDIVITNGCQEALMLSLRTVTKPGDIVAVESPTYYSLLQAIDVLGLKALEIPTHPQEGISLSALELAFEQWPIKACVVIPNFHNPLGYVMPDANKQALVNLANQHKVTIIEDDVYGEISFDHRRPRLLQSFADSHRVIHCSSVSKTLAPGLRMGWIVSRTHATDLRYQKFVNNCATSAINQLAVADLMQSGRYDRHLRTLRMALAQAVKRMIDSVGRYFPPSIKITQPQGGYVIWVELPKKVDADVLAQKAFEHGISIASGGLFSPSKKYSHCIRLNCAVDWNDQTERALMRLGELIKVASP